MSSPSSKKKSNFSTSGSGSGGGGSALSLSSLSSPSPNKKTKKSNLNNNKNSKNNKNQMDLAPKGPSVLQLRPVRPFTTTTIPTGGGNKGGTTTGSGGILLPSPSPSSVVSGTPTPILSVNPRSTTPGTTNLTLLPTTGGTRVITAGNTNTTTVGVGLNLVAGQTSGGIPTYQITRVATGGVGVGGIVRPSNINNATPLTTSTTGSVPIPAASITVTPISTSNIRIAAPGQPTTVTTINNGAWIGGTAATPGGFSPIRAATITVGGRPTTDGAKTMIHIPQQHVAQLQMVDGKGSILKPQGLTTTPIVNIRGPLPGGATSGTSVTLQPFTLRTANITTIQGPRPPQSTAGGIMTTTNPVHKVLSGGPSGGAPILVNAANAKNVIQAITNPLPKLGTVCLTLSTNANLAPNNSSPVVAVASRPGLAPSTNPLPPSSLIMTPSSTALPITKVYPVGRDGTPVSLMDNQLFTSVSAVTTSGSSGISSSASSSTSSVTQHVLVHATTPTINVGAQNHSSSNPSSSFPPTGVGGSIGPSYFLQDPKNPGAPPFQIQVGTPTHHHHHSQTRTMPITLDSKKVMGNSLPPGSTMIITAAAPGPGGTHHHHPQQTLAIPLISSNTNTTNTQQANLSSSSSTIITSSSSNLVTANHQHHHQIHLTSIPLSHPSLGPTITVTPAVSSSHHLLNQGTSVLTVTTTTISSSSTSISTSTSSGSASSSSTNTSTSVSSSSSSASSSTTTTTTGAIPPAQSPNPNHNSSSSTNNNNKSTHSPRPSILRKREHGGGDQNSRDGGLGGGGVGGGFGSTQGGGGSNNPSSRAQRNLSLQLNFQNANHQSKSNQPTSSSSSTTTVLPLESSSIISGLSILKKEFQPPTEESSWQSVSSNSSSGSSTISTTSETAEIQLRQGTGGGGAGSGVDLSLSSSSTTTTSSAFVRLGGGLKGNNNSKDKDGHHTTSAPSSRKSTNAGSSQNQNGVLPHGKSQPRSRASSTSKSGGNKGDGGKNKEKDKEDSVSPRKKPRKQQLNTSDLLEAASPEIYYQGKGKRFRKGDLVERDSLPSSGDKKIAPAPPFPLSSDDAQSFHQHHQSLNPLGGGESSSTSTSTLPSCSSSSYSSLLLPPKTISYHVKRKHMSLLQFNAVPPKPLTTHFQKYSEVKAKDEKRPGISELANSKNINGRISGWKLQNVAGQMMEVVDNETEVVDKCSSLLSQLEGKVGPNCKERDLNTTIELLKGNIQRCKVIRDQISDSRLQVLKMVEHQPHVQEVINKYSVKRPPAKKRTLL